MSLICLALKHRVIENRFFVLFNYHAVYIHNLFTHVNLYIFTMCVNLSFSSFYIMKSFSNQALTVKIKRNFMKRIVLSNSRNQTSNGTKVQIYRSTLIAVDSPDRSLQNIEIIG